MRNYTDLNYANARLVGTYVRHISGKAIEVSALAGGRVVAKELITGLVTEFPYEELDITPIPLGYINSGGKATYIARSPMRNDWKQGARGKNLRWIGFGEDMPMLRDGDIPRKAFGELVEGIFPSYMDSVRALTMGKGKVFSRAWCRNFAMTTDFNLFHKGRFFIGKMTNPLTKEYKLNDEHWWAKEALEESLA